MLKHLQRSDAMVVWKLDRLCRSLRHLIDIVSELENRGIELVPLQDNVDTTSTIGNHSFAIFGVLAEFERDIIRERT